MRLVFSAAATKGWAWCSHNAKLLECTAALRNLLLAGSGCLEFPKGMAGMDSLNKHVEQISFRHWVKFSIMGSWKAGSPTSNPLWLKFSTIDHWFAAVTCHNWEHNQYPVIQIFDTINHCIVRNKSRRPQLRDHSASLSETGLFLQLQRRDGHDAAKMQSWWSVLRLSETCFWQGVNAWNSKKEWREWIP